MVEAEDIKVEIAEAAVDTKEAKHHPEFWQLS
jgi:hypothetical protein